MLGWLLLACVLPSRRLSGVEAQQKNAFVYQVPDLGCEVRYHPVPVVGQDKEAEQQHPLKLDSGNYTSSSNQQFYLDVGRGPNGYTSVGRGVQLARPGQTHDAA